MCKVLEDMRNETAKKAVEQDRISIALDMIKDGKLSIEQISRYSKLAIEKVAELASLKTAR